MPKLAIHCRTAFYSAGSHLTGEQGQELTIGKRAANKLSQRPAVAES